MEAKIFQFPQRPSRAATIQQKTVEEICEQAVLEAKTRAIERVSHALKAANLVNPAGELSVEDIAAMAATAARILAQATKELLDEVERYRRSITKPPSP